MRFTDGGHWWKYTRTLDYALGTSSVLSDRVVESEPLSNRCKSERIRSGEEDKIMTLWREISRSQGLVFSGFAKTWRIRVCSGVIWSVPPSVTRITPGRNGRQAIDGGQT